MQVYQLDNKSMDDDFLKGKPVSCRAVIEHAITNDTTLKEGDPVLIILSNGKKYKGRIHGINFFNISNFAVGELEIIRSK